MRRQVLILLLTGSSVMLAGSRVVFSAGAQATPPTECSPSETTGKHVRIETEHGALHFWIPQRYDPRSAGMVIYIHGYFSTVDQTWIDNRLDAQFQASGRNALFIAIEAPASTEQDVRWTSLNELLHVVQIRAPFPVPHGPLVIVGHSGGFRTILLWLRDPRVQYVILLDGLYAGQADYRYWLRPRPRGKSHRMVLVASDTWQDSNQLARRTSGAVRVRSVPASASAFTPRETRARLLCVRCQYDHMEMISNGKVIPVLLQISPIRTFPAPTTRVRRASSHHQSVSPARTRDLPTEPVTQK